MEKRTTKITRSWGATIGFLIGGLVALAISVVLFMTIVEGAVTHRHRLDPRHPRTYFDRDVFWRFGSRQLSRLWCGTKRLEY